MAWDHVLNMLTTYIILTAFLVLQVVTPSYALSPYDSRHLAIVLQPTDPCEINHLENQNRYICKEVISGTGDIKTEFLCLPGWTGDQCQKPVCGKTCQHPNGRCIAPGICQCHLGYRGAECASCMKRPGCLHGSCEKPYQCNCNTGYSGIFCSEPLCKEGCSRIHGYCSVPQDACMCQQGWQGINCTECVPMPGCVNGVCFQPLECNCLNGWTGTFCDIPICKDSCHKKNGFCHLPGDCICQPGYEGDLCKKCSVNPYCINGGCNKPWDCNCKYGWTGKLCDTLETQVFGQRPRDGRCFQSNTIFCKNLGIAMCTYLGNGTMAKGTQPRCVCPTGFTGANCEIEATPKSTETSNADHNHGHDSGSNEPGERITLQNSRDDNEASRIIYEPDSLKIGQILKEKEEVNNTSDNLFLKVINKTTDNFIKVKEKEVVDDSNNTPADYGSIRDIINATVNLNEREGDAGVEDKPLEYITVYPHDYFAHQNNPEEDILRPVYFPSTNSTNSTTATTTTSSSSNNNGGSSTTTLSYSKSTPTTTTTAAAIITAITKNNNKE